MANEILRARAAVAAGRDDEALVLLWQALEPARLAGDEATLAEIASIARSIPRDEARQLVAATGADPDVEPPATAVEVAGPAEKPRPLGRMTAGLWVVVLLVALVLGAILISRNWPDVSAARPGGPSAKVTLGADGLYLVPLGRYPEAELLDVGVEAIRHTGAMDVLSPVGMGPQPFDAGRSQFVAEDLLSALSDAYGIGSGHTILIVGVTSSDMYARAEPNTAYAEIARSTDGRYVVISTDHFEGDPEDQKARLRRLVLAEVRRVGFRKHPAP